MVTALELVFPALAGKDYAITSPQDDVYNCIAWSLEVSTEWWWPDAAGKGQWPKGVPREATLGAFRLMFMSFGLEDNPTDAYEIGFEKIALFASNGVPKHAARQLSTRRWTSKLGKQQDIEHDLRDVEGLVYGSAVLFMRRAVPGK
jgi:hypothetical protein